ncbi:hypothetical protein [Vibrio tapetis]|uniref:Uncharacterized protein n=1 Tax=Vibrio tapetis subsp. tapetis TaxID=1671868 RepID=A0A2N8ZLE3_9VIBR|nr:hypothetical protein [Vibrio tapetis]SON52706.1 protein of unknown function [Vibrio tapetis subsp. tapetis]
MSHSAIQHYNPESDSGVSHFTPIQLLQLTRPSYKTAFVKRGDETHLLVYLNDDQGLPFVRIPCDVLLGAAKAYESC